MKKTLSMTIGILIVLIVLLGITYTIKTSNFNFSTKSIGNKAPTGMGYQRDARIDYKDSTMVHLGDFTTNMSNGDKAGKFIRTAISAKVSSSDGADEIKKRNIIVRDIIIKELSLKSFSQISTNRGKMKLKEDIRQSINSKMQDGQIKEVYFTQFKIQ